MGTFHNKMVQMIKKIGQNLEFDGFQWNMYPNIDKF